MATWQWSGDIIIGTNRQRLIAGSGSPETVVTAPIGSLYLRLDGGISTALYVKEAGVGAVGWVGIGAGGGGGGGGSDDDSNLEATANWRFVRATLGATSGALAGPISINFGISYADNAYTVNLSTECAEDLASAGVVIAGFEKLPAGAGVKVWVQNNDSIDHTVTIHVTSRHD